jgi:hypothetical protein
MPLTVVKGHSPLAGDRWLGRDSNDRRGDADDRAPPGIGSDAIRQRHDGPVMPIGQLIAFAVWLALAMAGGALIVFVWERLRARYCGDRAGTPSHSESASRKDA